MGFWWLLDNGRVAANRRGHPPSPSTEDEVTAINFPTLSTILAAAVAAGRHGWIGEGPDCSANTGAIKLTTGIDIPSVYYFRGIRQETDAKLTAQPYGDVGITLMTADAGLKSAAINFGVWNSLHTGSSGSDLSGQSSHYEEDFYAGLTLGFSPLNFTTKYIAYTSPNGLWGPVRRSI